MSNLGRLPNDLDLPIELRGDPPSLVTLVRHEPRGAAMDRDAAIAKGALDVPALPGASEANEREAYRQKLVAANRALDGQVVNELGKGAIEGIAVAGLAVAWTIFGWEIAALAGVAVVGAAMFGGGR